MSTPLVIAVTFDGSFDGFMSVVYACYYEKIVPISILPENQAQLTLTFESRHIETNPTHAAKVFSAIREKISWEAAETIYLAFLSYEEDRFLPLLEYIKFGFSIGHMVESHHQKDFVRHIRKISRHVGREAHLLRGFCRFAETKQGIFYCKVTPKNNVITLLTDHFTQRLHGQSWIIHDQTYNQAAIYNGESLIITPAPKDAKIELAENEQEIQEQWTTFFNALSIKARTNPKLQRQLLPLYFRSNMTEFIVNEERKRKDFGTHSQSLETRH